MSIATRDAYLHAVPPFCTALLALASLAATPAGPRVWVAPAAQKIRPQVAPPASAAASAALFAARNEFESFHVVVTGAASAASMSLAALDDGRGHRIAGRDLVLYREVLFNVAVASDAQGGTGRWPDALIPDVDPIVGEKRNAFPFDVPAGESRAVLVDVHVPADAPAGVYRGTLQVSGGAVASVPVQVTVWDIALPSTPGLRTAFGMAFIGPWLHGNTARVVTDLNVRDRYLQAALDNRISIDTPARDVPVQADGGADWSEYDLHIAPFLEGTAPTRLIGARLTTARIESPLAYANTPIAAAWSQHFRARGWFDRLYDYVCDEPPATCAFSDIDPRIAQAHAGDPDLPVLVTTSAQAAKAHGVTGITVFSPVIDAMDGKPGMTYAGSQRALYGANLFWYQSCDSWGCGAHDQTGWPSYAIDTDGTRNRSMEWLSFSYGIPAELYFDTTHAYDLGPWTNQLTSGAEGDGTLFYPGTPALIGGATEIPIESLRMKGIRDGIEDHELLQMAASLGHEEEALAIARALFPRTFQAETTPAALDHARAQLAALILSAGTSSPDAGVDGGPADAGGLPPSGGDDAGAADAGGAPAPDGGAGADAGAPGVPDGGATDADAGGVGAPGLDGGLPGAVPLPTGGGGRCSSAPAGALWPLAAIFAALALRRRRLQTR